MKNVELNDKGEGVAVKPDPEAPKVSVAPAEKDGKAMGTEAPEQAMAKTSLKENKRLLVLMVGVVLFILIAALALYEMLNTTSMRRKLMAGVNKKEPVKSNSSERQTNATNVGPILDAGHPTAQNADGGRVTAEVVGQTAKKQPKPATPTTLGGVKPFDGPQPWQAPTYHPGTQPFESANGESGREASEARSERDLMDKPSLVFVK